MTLDHLETWPWRNSLLRSIVQVVALPTHSAQLSIFQFFQSPSSAFSKYEGCGGNLVRSVASIYNPQYCALYHCSSYPVLLNVVFLSKISILSVREEGDAVARPAYFG